MARLTEKEIYEDLLKNIKKDDALLRALNTGSKKLHVTPGTKRPKSLEQIIKERWPDG